MPWKKLVQHLSPSDQKALTEWVTNASDVTTEAGRRPGRSRSRPGSRPRPVGRRPRRWRGAGRRARAGRRPGRSRSRPGSRPRPAGRRPRRGAGRGARGANAGAQTHPCLGLRCDPCRAAALLAGGEGGGAGPGPGATRLGCPSLACPSQSSHHQLVHSSPPSAEWHSTLAGMARVSSGPSGLPG